MLVPQITPLALPGSQNIPLPKPLPWETFDPALLEVSAPSRELSNPRDLETPPNFSWKGHFAINKSSFAFIAGAVIGARGPTWKVLLGTPRTEALPSLCVGLWEFWWVIFVCFFSWCDNLKQRDAEPLAFPESCWWRTSRGPAAAGSIGAGTPPWELGI